MTLMMPPASLDSGCPPQGSQFRHREQSIEEPLARRDNRMIGMCGRSKTRGRESGVHEKGRCLTHPACGDVLKDCMALAINDPVKLAGLLGAIRAPSCWLFRAS